MTLKTRATGQLAGVNQMPGASEVKSINLLSADPSTTRQTLVTPTSGKRIRVIAIGYKTSSATDSQFDFWFGTGINVVATPAKHVMSFNHSDNTVNPGPFFVVFPDGGGPLGDVDEVLSVGTGASVGLSAALYWTHYREE